jgi:predicted Zn-dependent protease with MMP-like domain
MVRRVVFERLVHMALRELPADFRERLDNVQIVIRDEPDAADLAEVGLDARSTLFGLYQGVPQPERVNYGFNLPDRITLFQGPIERSCRSNWEIRREVRQTVWHELAHHFGISDARLHELGFE